MALWNGRFEKDSNNALIEFSESVSFDKRLYAHDIAGSKAHVQMLAESKIIPQKTAKQIISALNKIQKKIESGKFIFTPELEDIHMHIENEIIAELGDEGARLHTARSRNDQIALDIRLYLRDLADNSVSKIRDLQIALLRKANENRDTIMPGFTHLQHAQPVLFAHHLLAYIEMFQRDIERMNDCKKRINVMPLGSGALAGTTLPINRKRVAELLHFPEITNNSLDAVSDRDFICEILSVFAIFAMHVSRLSEDIVIWSSQEFSFIELDDAFCTGSSLMPQKKNPDIAELARGKTGRFYGNLLAVLTMLKGLPLSYNRDMQEDKKALFDTIDTFDSLLNVLPPMIYTMKIKHERMFSAASDPALMATDLAEYLVKKGIPFRESHKVVGKLIKYAANEGKKLDSLSIQEIQKIIPAADKTCLNLFSAKLSISKRESPGATGFKQVKKQLDKWKSRLKL